MSQSLNKNVADFEYKGRKYEVDLLLDSMRDGFATYDIFDVTDSEKGEIEGQFTLNQQEENDYMSSDIIREAKEELERSNCDK